MGAHRVLEMLAGVRGGFEELGVRRLYGFLGDDTSAAASS